MRWKGPCSSTRLIDGWKVRCTRDTSHVIHQTLFWDRNNQRVYVEWDDRPSFVSDWSAAQMRDRRNEMIREKGR